MDVLKGIAGGNPEIVLIVISAIIIGLVRAVRQTDISPKLLPFISIILGIIISIIGFDYSLKKEILLGIWLGLGAVGLHSGFKNTFPKDTPSSHNDYLNFFNLKK